MTDPGSDDPVVRFAPDGVLLERALTLLEVSPREAALLAERVLGIRGGPPALADRLVASLLEAEPRARRGPDGLWRLERTAPARTDRRLDRLRYAVVDVETTGGVAGRGGRILEIAIVHVDGASIAESFSTLLDTGGEVPAWISRLTGIRTEMIRGAPRFSEIADAVRARLGGRVFVAHSAGYDWGFLGAEMRRVGAAPPRGPRLCTVHLARRLLPGLDRRSLDSLARYYGVDIFDRHRAQGDAVATARILLRLLADADRRGWTTWDALRRALAETPPRKRRRRTGIETARREGGAGAGAASRTRGDGRDERETDDR